MITLQVTPEQAKLLVDTLNTTADAFEGIEGIDVAARTLRRLIETTIKHNAKLRVITGYSEKNDGMLVVSAKPLDEVAKQLGLHHIHLDNVTEFGEEIKGGVDIFSREEIDHANMRERIEERGCLDASRYSWFVRAMSIEVDVNLADAVVW